MTERCAGDHGQKARRQKIRVPLLLSSGFASTAPKQCQLAAHRSAAPNVELPWATTTEELTTSRMTAKFLLDAA